MPLNEIKTEHDIRVTLTRLSFRDRKHFSCFLITLQ